MTDIHFFPAQFIGGAPMLEDILKPFEHLKLNVIVNGGITEDCLKDYLALESVAAIVTPWIVTENDIEYKQWGDVHDKALKLKEMINNKRVIYFNK
jgi:2-keto-3-deoxy-6-phosphogluconate aldolase